MNSREKVAAMLIVGAAAAFVLAPAGKVAADGIQQVLVTNWPGVFAVEGTVSIKAPIKTGQLVARRDVVVPPVFPKDTTRLINAGTLDCDGFTQMVLSLQGQTKGEVVRPGRVGAILIPDDEPIVRAFDEKGLTQFELELEATNVSSSSTYFDSNQPRYPIAFPRYRVYLYNTADKSVTVNFYAYMTN